MQGARFPTLEFERCWWLAGYRHVAGVDEVGRGALAGPIVAAAVVLPAAREETAHLLSGVLDSKLLKAEQRVEWLPVICAVAEMVAVGVAEADEVDACGVAAANRMAIERSVLALPQQPDVVLADAVVTDLPLPQVGIVDGDALSLTIAAASIVAKVARDRLMSELHGCVDAYGFHLHKGYGTPVHLGALDTAGPCAQHRRSFAPVGLRHERAP